MRLVIKNWTTIILILSIIAISSALIAEHIFNLLPCHMCYHQRYPYYFIIFIIIFSYFLKKNNSILPYVLMEIAIFYGLFYTFWHVGIERKIFSVPANCSTTLENIFSKADLKQQILNQNVVNCSDITWAVFGVSAATLNLILLLFLLFFNTIYIYKINYDKEKN